MKKVKLVFTNEEGKSLVLLHMSEVKENLPEKQTFLILCLMGKSMHITQGNFIAPLVEDEN